MLEMFLVTNPELRGSSLIAALILADPLKERGFDVCCFPPLLSWDFHLLVTRLLLHNVWFVHLFVLKPYSISPLWGGGGGVVSYFQ